MMTSDPTPRAQSADIATDPVEISRSLGLLGDADYGIEIRGLPSRRSKILPARDLDNLTCAAVSMAGDSGVYYTLNPIPAKLSHPSRLEDVICRRWLLFDVDSVRSPHYREASATDAEKQAAQRLAEALRHYLRQQGWPEPLLIDSGNGYHLLYRIHMAADETSAILLREILHRLADLFHDAGAVIDRSVHNANRIARLPGTVARKGTSSPDRPHRLCRLLEVPNPILILTPGQIQRQIDTLPPCPSPGEASETLVDVPIFQVRATDTPTAAYGLAALEREVARVAGAAPGQRNSSLNRAAFSLSQLVGGGVLSAEVVMDRLYQAACQCGLLDDPGCGAAGIRSTIRSGMAAGAARPRTAPEPLSEAMPVPNAPRTTPMDRSPLIYPMPELLATGFPPPNWAIPGLLSEGLTVFAGKPKLGKSFCALNLALTIAAGGRALGSIDVPPGDVLYLSLEDRWRRVQDRTRKVLTGLPVAISRRLSVAVEWPRQSADGLVHLERWCTTVERPALVIIDVWARFRPPQHGGRNAYEQDYEHVAELKKLIDRYKASCLLVHHCKKAAAEDALDEISGTLGLAGAADGVLILTRARGEHEANLFVSGRDIEERELALSFDPQTFVWTCHGLAAERMESKLGEELIAIFKANAGVRLTVSDLADRTRTPPDKRQPLRCLLHRLTERGVLQRVGPGAYRWPIQDVDETTF